MDQSARGAMNGPIGLRHYDWTKTARGKQFQVLEQRSLPIKNTMAAPTVKEVICETSKPFHPRTTE